MLQQPLLPSSSAQGPDDEDVAAERHAVQSGQVGPHNTPALLRGVAKTYRQSGQTVRAVHGLWLSMGAAQLPRQAAANAASCPPGACFALLGQNGSGKTTTFSMLTGEVLPDCGDAFVAGHSLLAEPFAAHRNTGYCPQFRQAEHLLLVLFSAAAAGCLASPALTALVYLLLVARCRRR